MDDDDLSLAEDDAHLLVAGRFANVYLLDDTHVLRRLHDPGATHHNVALLDHLAAAGFPVPRVVRVEGPDLVMDRLHGATLLQALDAQEVTMDEGVQILLDLHARLHAVPVPSDLEVPGAAGPGDSLVHLDLHPANVLMTADGPYLINWDSAQRGPAELDLASTAIVFAEVAVDDNAYAGAAHVMLRAFLHAAGPALGTRLDEAATLRAARPTLDPDEVDLVPRGRDLVRQELDRL